MSSEHYTCMCKYTPFPITGESGLRIPLQNSLTGQKAVIVRIIGTWDQISKASPRYPDKTDFCPDNGNPICPVNGNGV